MGRHAHQCHYNGCDSAAEYEIHVKLWYKGRDGKLLPLEMKSTAEVCGKHRFTCMESLQTERSRQQVADQMRANNLPDPDFSSMTMEARRIEHPRELTSLEVAMLPKSQVVQCGQMEGVGEEQARCKMPASKQVVLSVRAIGQNKTHKPNKLLLNLCLCNRHAKAVTPESFLDLKTRSTLTGQLVQMGIPMPDFRTLEVLFEPMIGGKPVDPAKFQRDNK